jgi:hypothetical protein
MRFGHPGERQAGFDEGLPKRLPPAVIFSSIDSPGIGMSRQDPCHRLGDETDALTHDVSRSARARIIAQSGHKRGHRLLLAAMVCKLVVLASPLPATAESGLQGGTQHKRFIGIQECWPQSIFGRDVGY